MITTEFQDVKSIFFQNYERNELSKRTDETELVIIIMALQGPYVS
jgi:hypothetical protein